MPMRHAQRQHVIVSLERIVYQFHTLSFFLSPSLLTYLCRTMFQFQFARPREIDPKRSLRFWYFLILLFNVGSVWAHATEGAAKGRSIMLDFIGPISPPSKFHLLSLDLAIIILNMVLTSIAFETSLQSAMPSDTPDPLLPLPPPSMPSTPIPDVNLTKPDLALESPYVLDLRLSQVYDRLRNPTPQPPDRDSSADDLLPLPNLTSSRISRTLGILMRARARAIQRTRTEADGNRGQEGAEDRRTVPGGLDSGL